MPIEPPRPYDPHNPRAFTPPKPQAAPRAEITPKQHAILEQLLDGPKAAGKLKAPARALLQCGLIRLNAKTGIIQITAEGRDLYQELTGI